MIHLIAVRAWMTLSKSIQSTYRALSLPDPNRFRSLYEHHYPSCRQEHPAGGYRRCCRICRGACREGLQVDVAVATNDDPEVPLGE